MKDFKVTITDPERAAEWLVILGTTTVCVESPFPILANLPGHPRAEIYLLDLDLLTVEQRERLISHLCRKFGVPAGEAETEIARAGIPILAEHCILIIDNPIRWLS